MRITGKAILAAGAALAAIFAAVPSHAAPFFFSTGGPDGKIATLSRPGTPGKIETESADDFVLTSETKIDIASFTGLLTNQAGVGDIGQVRVEIYRVFPLDSTDPPSGNVVTRVNSPSDVAFAERDINAGELTFTATNLGSFTANNSVVNGINKKPNQTTGGEGPVTGTEVQLTVTLTTPLDLQAGHYFFIPQVQVTTANGEFLWLSAPKPITGPGTTPFLPDLQSWIRNENLAPDWSRIGTDIVGGATPPTFNASFSLSGVTVDGNGGVPLPTALNATAATGLCLATFSAARKRRTTSLA